MVPATLQTLVSPRGMPDHTQLPDEDPSAVHNDHEHPQSNLLTECLLPKLDELHPDGNYWVGADVGIYFTYTNPVLDGCRVPDWVYVPGVPRMLDGELRRSYVLWQELLRPAIVIEYVSGDGSEEHDRTPHKGKFWIYERVIAAGYYVIFDPRKRSLEVFVQNGDGYHEVPPNEAGRFLIKGMNVELGIWDGTYRLGTTSWLRVWDPATGEMIPTDKESLQVAKDRAEVAKQRAEAAEMGQEEMQSIFVEQATELDARGKRIDSAEKLAEAERRRADENQKRVEAERRRADEQQKRADEQQKQLESERQRTALLLAKFREMGIDPPS
jgi:Uma2 family endonuclease